MAPKIDFYLLDRHLVDGRLRAACRLSKKIHKLGHRIYVQTPDLEQAKVLDDLMWTFDQSSFVPHGLYEPDRCDNDAPVAIGRHPPPVEGYNVLISLMESVPENYDSFPRVVELVDNTPEDKALARDRYRWYRDRGCELDKHEITV